jgi:F-type H+-transporting ATPase subunit b
MKFPRNRREAGLASTEWAGIGSGVVLIALAVTVLKGGVWEQSPIPGIDFSTSRMLINIGLILILFPLIRVFYIAPFKAAIESRNNDLERTFTEAEQLRASMEQLRKDYEQRLAATEASAREQIQAQIREAQVLRQTLMAEATQKADALLQQAHDQIEQEKSKAIVDIRSAVVDLTLSATEKIIGDNMDSARNRRLVEEFIAGVEVAR